jgi:hypothetical protein
MLVGDEGSDREKGGLSGPFGARSVEGVNLILVSRSSQQR